MPSKQYECMSFLTYILTDGVHKENSLKTKRVQFNVIETKIDESVIKKQYDLPVDFNYPSFLYHL